MPTPKTKSEWEKLTTKAHEFARKKARKSYSLDSNFDENSDSYKNKFNEISPHGQVGFRAMVKFIARQLK